MITTYNRNFGYSKKDLQEGKYKLNKSFRKDGLTEITETELKNHKYYRCSNCLRMIEEREILVGDTTKVKRCINCGN